VIRCGNCGRDNRQGRRFCAGCGTASELKCPHCGASNELDEDYCGQCGSALVLGSGPVAERQPAPAVHIVADNSAAQPLDGERKTVTALFADIKGSMELMEGLDPEEARAIVDPALKLMIDAVHRYGGYIVQSTGDGIFALFGAPVAHEDHPQRALFTALRLQEQLGRYSSQLRGQGRMPLQARVGLNTGDVVVRSIETSEGHTEYTPIGHSTSLAARVQTLAPVGSIATTDTTRKLCEGYFTFKSLGPTVVKGVSEPLEVFEVTGLGPLRTRFQRSELRGLTKFVGRRLEMEALTHAAEQAQAGNAQIIAVMADPGAGKSRLFYEFKSASRSGWMVLQAFSVSYGRASAYLPVLELLSAYFGIEPGDDVRKRRERVGGKILMLDRSLEDALPYIFTLFGLSEGDNEIAQMGPQIRRRRMQDAIKRILLRESLNQPLMLIFEDLHWIDEESQALLNLLVDSLGTTQILLLMNYRPEYQHHWGNRPYYTQLRLDPLGRESAEEMLDALLKAAVLSPSPARSDILPLAPSAAAGERADSEFAALKRLIIQRSEGNPFFMEEIVQELFDEGAIDRNGQLRLTKPLAELKIPATVQATLAARIDRLGAVDKELLQTLAVMGKEIKEIPLALIKKSIGKPEGQLEATLSVLQVNEFICEQPNISNALYVFKHALTQQVAYNSLLTERRRSIHEQTAKAIEAVYAGQLEDHYNELARHHLSGNDPGRAAHYAILAAEQAMSRAAYPEAVGLIEDALKLLERLPEDNERLEVELKLRTVQSALAVALHGGASREREAAIRRMCELGERLDLRDQLVGGLIALAGLSFSRGDSLLGQAQVKEYLSKVEEIQQGPLLAEAHNTAALLAYTCANFRQSLSHFDEAEADAGENVSPLFGRILFKAEIPSNRAIALQLLGYPDQALTSSEHGLRDAREGRNLFGLGLALTGRNMLSLNAAPLFPAGTFGGQREYELVIANAQQAIALSEENGFSEWLNWGRFAHGWAQSGLGYLEPGIAEMETAVAGFRQMAGVPFQHYGIALLAHSYARTGRTDKALALIHQAIAHIERSGEKADYAEMLRLKGEILR
jgi:class 3 adenylate cyclase/tetratricopeptide (TPR) repeat protein